MVSGLHLTSKIVYGEDCVLKNQNIFSSFGKKCIIVTSRTSAVKSGALKDVTLALQGQGIEYILFDKITENPLVSSVIEGGALARDFGADFVIGIGGGSPLDASKAVAICTLNPQYDIDGLYNRPIPSKALPVILIGTTSGTGSEVTGVSVLTNDKLMQKKSISGTDCYAAVCFCDARYTCSMTYSVTVSTALDAFAHAVEGWFSKKCTDTATLYAKKALPLIYNGLKKLYETGELPDETVREELYSGSLFAGLELNICGAAFPHTMGYVLTEEFSVPHGKACTAFMPALLKRAKTCCPQRFDELLEVLDDSFENIICIVTALTDLKGFSASKEQIADWCSRWEGNKNFNNSPGGFSVADAILAMEELL